MTIIQALQDRDLLGRLPAFRQLESWVRWLIFLGAVYGLPLDAEQVDIFCKHTGRTRYAPPPDGYREAVASTGRQSGKTEIGARIVGHEACQVTPEAEGADLYAIAVSQDHRASMRTMFRSMVAPFEVVPALAQLVVRQTQDTLQLSTGVTLAAYPCRPPAVRGLRAKVVVADELGHYRNAEGSPQDTEMLRALRPCLATTRGRLIILSSPYAQVGALWDLYRRHYGQDESDTLFWKASAPEMNPLLPTDYLERMAKDDPEAYQSEVLGEFRAGVSALFNDNDVLEAAVDRGVKERLPV